MTQEHSSSILFQNEINSKTIFLDITRKSYQQKRMPSKNEFLNLYDILSAYKSRDCISPNMSTICWNLEVLHCAATAQWKHSFLRHVGKECISTSRLGKSASVTSLFGRVSPTTRHKNRYALRTCGKPLKSTKHYQLFQGPRKMKKVRGALRALLGSQGTYPSPKTFFNF